MSTRQPSKRPFSVFVAEHLVATSIPGVANSRIGIGKVLGRMGKHEEALVEYQQALRVFLALVMARSTRAWPRRT